MVSRKLIRCFTIPTLAALVLAGGCASREGVRQSSAARSVAESEALILPGAGGPAVIGVVERRHGNAVEQEVALFTSASTPGQNALRIQAYGPMESQLDRQERLAYRSVLAADIGREMAREFPGVTLRRSELFLRNIYGPFGHAFGTSPSGDTCLYGWQQLRANETERRGFQNRGTIQIRLRLCDATASQKDLLAVMYGYTITANFAAHGWNPYGDPRSVDPAIGASGNPVYPVAGELSGTLRRAVAVPAAERVVSREPRQASPRQVVSEENAVPEEDVVQVPSPFPARRSDTGTGAVVAGDEIVVPSPPAR